MHCKSFTISLTPAVTPIDTDALTMFLKTVDVTTVHTALVPSLGRSKGAADGPFWSVLVFYRDQQPAEPVALPPNHQTTDVNAPPAEPLTSPQQAIHDQLKIWRRERARQDGVPVYVVAHNATLQQLARQADRIQTPDDLLTIERLGPAKIEKYGPELLELLRVAAEE
ncbi:MAG: HRDC domain-containing protein [Chloroflexales bacterium]|nr:HRDC domain-containing protein [Chloroflexales bacterium]